MQVKKNNTYISSGNEAKIKKTKMSTAVNKEIERLQKMIERKELEIKEHKELIEMWKKQLEKK